MQVEAEKIVMWGRSNSPLVVDNLVIVPAGGVLGAAKSLVAYDADTGKVVWEGGERQVSYSSASLFTLSGVRQLVIVNEDTVTGNDIKTGKELWSHPWPGRSNGPASTSQTHVIGPDRLLLSKGYGIGAELIEVKLVGGTWQVESLEKNSRVLKTKHTNVTVIGEHAYGLSDGVLECVEIATLEPKWKKGRYGHGQVLGVGDKILVLGEKGELALIAADPEEFRELGKIQALEGQTWNNLCLTGKLLLVRNAEEAACYELP
jgi:outer membrane protein assembly factor BamB